MPGTAVTIGAYDGVHLGHRALLRDLSERARARGLSTVVVTFDRHPAGVVRPESAPLQLTDLEQKLELLEACGIDRTVVIPFDLARAEESAEEFVQEVLVDQLSDALGSRLKVERAGRFRKSEEIKSLRIAMGDDQFDAEVDGSTLKCTIGRSSGGIRIRSEKVDVDTWLNRLLTVLKAEAANSQAVRLALENMVIGGNT